MKKILGPCDTLQLEPFVYPWAWDMAKESEANTWTPEEIPVAPDVGQYKDPKTPLEYIHLFEALMAQLTVFDIMRGDDIAENLQAIVQPQELRHFCKRMAWEEALHTRSYRYIIENLGLPASGPYSIYDRWQHVSAMTARVQLAEQLSKNLRAVYTNSLLHLENVKDGDNYWDIEEQQQVLLSMIFWFLIFEGVWFMVNLRGPLQNLARMSYFRACAEQFQYIARDEEQHIRFGIRLINAFIKENPDALTPDFKENIQQLFEKSMILEEDYACYFMERGPILGYSVGDHMETCRHFCNLRAAAVNLDPPFTSDARMAFPWWSEMMDIKKEKNFFETRVTEYQVATGLDWGD